MPERSALRFVPYSFSSPSRYVIPAAAQSARIPYFIRFIMGPAANLAFFAGPRNILPRIYPKKVKNRALRVADRK